MDRLIKLAIKYRSFLMSCMFIVFAFAKANSQRNSNETIYSNSTVKVVDILLNSPIELEIITTSNKEIRISGSQGGEYKNALSINSKIENDTLKISDPFNPTFEFPQDKLSAHKIIDDKATLYLPEELEVIVNSRNCFLKTTGIFKKLFINIESGSCLFNKVIGDFQIISVHADVQILHVNSFITTNSKYGVIKMESREKRKRFYQKIETIHGDITIRD